MEGQNVISPELLQAFPEMDAEMPPTASNLGVSSIPLCADHAPLGKYLPQAVASLQNEANLLWCLIDIKSFAADPETSIDELQSRLNELCLFTPTSNKLKVTIKEMNRIVSAYFEEEVDLEKNFVLKIRGSMFPRLLQFFDFPR